VVFTLSTAPSLETMSESCQEVTAVTVAQAGAVAA
jgi:hypothetical protein